MGKSWKYLPLNNGYKAKVDAEDFDRVNQYRWHVSVKKDTGKKYAATNIKNGKGSKKVTLAKFIMNPPKGKMVYVRRGELDYRKENLLVCSMAERQRMLPKNKNGSSTSKFKGVCFDNTRRRWRAEITIKGQSFNLGFFKSEKAAAEAYNRVAEEKFGYKTYLNELDVRRNRRSIDR